MQGLLQLAGARGSVRGLETLSGLAQGSIMLRWYHESARETLRRPGTWPDAEHKELGLKLEQGKLPYGGRHRSRGQTLGQIVRSAIRSESPVPRAPRA